MHAQLKCEMPLKPETELGVEPRSRRRCGAFPLLSAAEVVEGNRRGEERAASSAALDSNNMQHPAIFSPVLVHTPLTLRTLH